MADVITTLHPEGAPEDNLYPNVKDANIPESIQRSGDMLWVNMNPDIAFASTTISVPLSSYSYLDVYIKITTGQNEAMTLFRVKMRNGDNTLYSALFDIGSGQKYSRLFRLYRTTDSIGIANGYVAGNIDDTSMIPAYIYGVN